MTSLSTTDWIRSFAALLAFTITRILLAAYKSQWRET